MRTQNGVPVTMTVPSYQVTFPGGDTEHLWQFRIPHPDRGAGDAGDFPRRRHRPVAVPRSAQPELRTDRISSIKNSRKLVSPARLYIQPGSQKIRTSTGLELQVLMPVVNAPFRVYWAYNPDNFQ